MSPHTAEAFFEQYAPEHDGFCSQGADCSDRVRHIKIAYALPAMAAEIDRLRWEANA